VTRGQDVQARVDAVPNQEDQLSRHELGHWKPHLKGVAPFAAGSVRDDASSRVDRLERHLRRLAIQPEHIGDPEPDLIPIVAIQNAR
jgi:hypothetical protein